MDTVPGAWCRAPVAAVLVASVAALLLDIAWWRGPLHRLYPQLNGWYHLAVYLPVVSAPLAAASLRARLGSGRAALYIIGGLMLASWVNDVLYYPVLGEAWRLPGYLIRFDQACWDRLHIGFTPCIPWWAFTASNLARPILGPVLLYTALRGRA